MFLLTLIVWIFCYVMDMRLDAQATVLVAVAILALVSAVRWLWSCAHAEKGAKVRIVPGLLPLIALPLAGAAAPLTVVCSVDDPVVGPRQPVKASVLGARQRPGRALRVEGERWIARPDEHGDGGVES